jgi:hypothetical protein
MRQGSIDGPIRHSERHRVQCRAEQTSKEAVGTWREWCPAPLDVSVALRRAGRTEALTGMDGHT